MSDSIHALLDEHARLIEEGENYAYFELAYTRSTEWMAWLCDKAPDADTGRPLPDRIVLACGQGHTADEACRLAIEDLAKRGKKVKA